MAPDPTSAIDHARQKWTALPPLVLNGVGTSLVESLSSYVARLLTTTGGTAVHLADGLGLQSTARLRRIGAFLKVKDPILAERNLEELERLTVPQICAVGRSGRLVRSLRPTTKIPKEGLAAGGALPAMVSGGLTLTSPWRGRWTCFGLVPSMDAFSTTPVLRAVGLSGMDLDMNTTASVTPAVPT